MKPIYKKKLPRGYFLVFNREPDIPFISVKQIHGTTIISTSHDGEEADGIVKNLEDEQSLAIKTADCLAVAIIGEKGSALIHAGWRGLAQNMISNPAIQELRPSYFFIGPSIRQKSFQVTCEFHDHFPNSKHLFNHGGFDLQQELKDQIKTLYQNAQVEDCALDTYSDERFHSYRRNKTMQRNWNLLVNTL